MGRAFMEHYSQRDDIVVFASGVSNSKSASASDFLREEMMVLRTIDQYSDRILVYFSSCSIYDQSLIESAYVRHKLNIEKLIMDRCPNYKVFRVSNVVGSIANQFTIFNYLVQCIRHGYHFDLWMGATRNLIDVDDVVKIVNYIIDRRSDYEQIFNVANIHEYSVQDLVLEMENFFGTKGNYTSIDKGERVGIDTNHVKEICLRLDIDFSHGYITRLLKKYYA